MLAPAAAVPAGTLTLTRTRAWAPGARLAVVNVPARMSGIAVAGRQAAPDTAVILVFLLD